MLKDPFLNKVVKDYRIVKRVGRGTFGSVYLAQHVRLSKKLFAVKILHPHIASEPEIVERFKREAESLAILSHPNIVQIIDFDFSGELGHFLVMEWLKGITLKKYLKENIRIPLKKTVEIFSQLMRGLEDAHRNGIIHRDLKPANIMLIPLGDSVGVKILDFGIAALKDNHDITQEGIAMGSANYISPEQAMGRIKEVDARSDLYSCGIIFAKCITGENVFTGNSSAEIIIKHINMPPPPLNELYPQGKFSEALERFYQKSIQKDRDKRFQTAGEFAREMRRAAEEEERRRDKTRDRSVKGGSSAVVVSLSRGSISREVVDRVVVIHPELESSQSVSADLMGKSEIDSRSSISGFSSGIFSDSLSLDLGGAVDNNELEEGSSMGKAVGIAENFGRVVKREASSVSGSSHGGELSSSLSYSSIRGSSGVYERDSFILSSGSELKGVRGGESVARELKSADLVQSGSFSVNDGRTGRVYAPLSPFEMVKSGEGEDSSGRIGAENRGVRSVQWYLLGGMGFLFVLIFGGIWFFGGGSEKGERDGGGESVFSGISVSSVEMCPKKGGEMVLIPAGTVWVRLKGRLESVYLDNFCIDKTEVTIGEYKKCADSGNCRKLQVPVGTIVRGKLLKVPLPLERLYPSNYPVSYISWRDARRFCRWAGKRLPREIEWERAVRGAKKTPYLWGKTSPTCLQAVSRECTEGSPLPVMSAVEGVTFGGVFDLIGNVAEYVEDCYLLERTKPYSGFREGCSFRVIKGGSFLDSRFSKLFDSFERRGAPVSDSFRFIGFRCAYGPR